MTTKGVQLIQAQRIKIARKISQMTQSAVAAKAGILRGSITNWERGSYGIDESSFNKLLKVFSEFNPEWLRGSVEGPMYKDGRAVSSNIMASADPGALELKHCREANAMLQRIINEQEKRLVLFEEIHSQKK